MNIKKILLTTDFSELARSAYPAGVQLASKFDASLVLAHSAESMPPYYYMHLEGIATDIPQIPYLEELSKKLEEEASEHLGSSEASVETQLIYHAFTPQAIVDFAKENEIDLIVTATHGRTGLGHFFLGSFAEKLLRLSSTPVYIHRAHEGKAQPPAFSRALVPFDFSANAMAVLPAVKFLSQAFETRFSFLHVLAPIPYTIAKIPESRSMFDIQQAFMEAPMVAEKRFEQIKEAELSGVDAQFMTTEGEPAPEIVRIAAEKNVDLVLMATHGWSGLQHLMMGSVAEKVAQKAPCSVLSVRPSGEVGETKA